MSSLTSEKCTACRRDSPRVNEEEMTVLKPLVPDWKLLEREGIQRLERVFGFANFAEALDFTNRVGAVAEVEFSVQTGVRSMNEVYLLERVEEAYERMLSGKARFRVVLTTGN
jgi:hypothetical protein